MISPGWKTGGDIYQNIPKNTVKKHKRQKRQSPKPLIYKAWGFGEYCYSVFWSEGRDQYINISNCFN